MLEMEPVDPNAPFWTQVNNDSLYIELLYKREQAYQSFHIRVPDAVLDAWVALGNTKMFLDANFLKAIRNPDTSEIEIVQRNP